MGAVAIPYLWLAGVDISATNPVTQAQLMQAINQLAPKSNAGGVIIMSSANGVDFPDTANYPYLKRCVWIDTYTNPPVIRLHDQTGGNTFAEWDSIGLATNTITNAHIQNTTIQVGKLSPTGGNAKDIFRINAAGTAIEFVDPNAMFDTGDVPLTALSVSGAPAAIAYLTRDSGGGLSWRIGNYSDLTGTPVLADQGVALAKIVNTDVGASALQTLRRNVGNTATEWATPIFSQDSGWIDLASDVTGSGAIIQQPHNLTTTPTLLRAAFQCLSTDLGFAAGNVVDVNCFADPLTGEPACSYRASSANLIMHLNSAVNYAVVRESATIGNTDNIDETKWKPVMRAWA